MVVKQGTQIGSSRLVAHLPYPADSYTIQSPSDMHVGKPVIVVIGSEVVVDPEIAGLHQRAGRRIRFSIRHP